MIKFFRKIRKGLLPEGKTARYLKYAIGEIVLVVIGILIALQINNWNESRKASIEEIVILKSLHENLLFAKIQSDVLIKKEQDAVNTLILVLDIDSMGSESQATVISDVVFRDVLWNLQTALPVLNRYNDLKNANKLGLIKNQEIKEKFTLIEIYLDDVQELLDDRMDVQQIRIDNVAEKDLNFIPFLKDILPRINIENEPKNDYAQILNVQRVRNLIAIKLFLTQDIYANRKKLDKEIEDLIGLIETELEALK